MSYTRSSNQYKSQKNSDSGTAVLKKGTMKEDNNTETRHVLDHKEASTIDAQARDWFKSLSSEERSGATRFSDRAFLGTFLTLATPWLAPTATASATTATTQGNDDNHGSLSGEY